MTPLPLEVRFDNCEAGWIALHLTVANQTLDLQLSHWLDPLPDLLAWLEAVSLGLARCGWTLDQEGNLVTFDVQDTYAVGRCQRVPESITLTVVPDAALPALTCTLSRHQLVRAFYAAFCEFVASGRYVAKQWALQTFGELVRETTGQHPTAWLETLLAAPLTRRELQKRFWLVHRGVTNPVSPDDELIGSAAEYAEMTSGEALPTDSYPVYWSHCEWEALPDDAARRAYLQACLDDSEDCAWRGLPWQYMRSSWLEQWLSKGDADSANVWTRWTVDRKSAVHTVTNEICL